MTGTKDRGSTVKMSQNLSNELFAIAPLIVFLQIVMSLISIFMIYIIIKNLTESKFLSRFFTIALAFFQLMFMRHHKYLQ